MMLSVKIICEMSQYILDMLLLIHIGQHLKDDFVL
jgi:hypothetical protein